jgi:hypothetical protein
MATPFSWIQCPLGAMFLFTYDTHAIGMQRPNA